MPSHAPLAAALIAALAVAASPARAGIPLTTVGDTDITVEGLLQYDVNDFHSDVADLDGPPSGDSAEHGIRRAEVVLKGAGKSPLSWVVGYDFKAERWLDVNAGWKFDGGVALVVGQSKVPVGLEELGSSRTNDFIAKAGATTMLAIGRRLGAQAQWTRGDWFAAGSVFGRELSPDMNHGGGFAARAVWAPTFGDGRRLHLGAAVVDADTDADFIRLRARPQADFAAVRLVDAGGMSDADRLRTVGGEAAWLSGPWKVQGEWLHGRVDRLDGADFDADGAYASAVWNVTGEAWGYKNGTIATPAPADGGRGLWQVGARWDRVDLDDGTVAGGVMDALTVGVNWYWREHVRLSLNHVSVRSERGGVDDEPSIVEARAQLHW